MPAAYSPQHLQAMLISAQNAAQAGMCEQAERIYREILRVSPKVLEVQFRLAVLLATTDRAREAIPYFRQLLKAQPTHALSHVNLANALKDANELDEATLEYRRAIALDARMTRAYWGLGSVLRKQGKSTEAIPCFKKTLELENSNADALNSLGLAYRDVDELPQAIEHLEKAVQVWPDNAEFRFNLGDTLRRADFHQAAVEQLYQAVTIKPDMVEAVIKLGETLQEQRRFDEALECFRRAIELKPEDPEGYEHIGQVYLDMGDAERALNQFRLMLGKYPKHPRALLGLGRALMEAGRSDEAAATLEELVTEHPKFDEGYFYLAASHKFKHDDKIIPQLCTFAECAEGDAEAIALHSALGKIYDDCKQWADAFKHYEVANRLRNKQYQYVPAEQEAWVDALIAAFSRDFFEAHHDCGMQSNKPVLIIGMPRSGTTLTEQIISSHPEVIGAGEVVFWGRAPTAVPATLGSQEAYPQCVVGINPENANKMAEEYLKLLAKIAGPGAHPARITDKMPHNFVHLGLIALLFPHAPIIHCKRDALDNCLSIFFQNFGGYHPYAYDLANIGHYYKQYERLMAHWHKVLPGRILDLNYEDTISDPEYWSRKLISYVGLEWNDACLAPHKLERTVKTASHWQVRQPIYKTSVKRWKNYEQWLGPLKEALGIESQSESGH